MYAQVESPKVNKSRVVSNPFVQKKSHVKQGSCIMINLHEAVAQRKLKGIFNNISQTNKLKAIQEMTNDRLPIVQREVSFDISAQKYDPKHNEKITSDIYKQQVAKLDEIGAKVIIKEGVTGKAEGTYQYNEDLSGSITMKPMNYSEDTEQYGTEFNSNIGTLTHEMQHALDDLTKQVRYRRNKENVLHTEWKAWAIQAAVTREQIRKGEKVTFEDSRMMKDFVDKVTLSNPETTFFKKTKVYLNLTKTIENASDDQVIEFMCEHTDWLSEALTLYYNNIPGGIGGEG